MSKERDIAIEVLPKMIEYFQNHRFKKPVLSVMPKDRNDRVRDSMETIAKEWDSKFDDTDNFQLSTIMGQFMDAIAWMPEERRRYIVGEIRKYRDIENPTAMISGKNRYGYNKSRLDGGLYKRKQMNPSLIDTSGAVARFTTFYIAGLISMGVVVQMNKPNWDDMIALLLMDMIKNKYRYENQAIIEDMFTPEDELVGSVDRDLPYEYQMDRVKEVKDED